MKEELITAIACITGFALAFLPLFLFADAGISPLYIGEKTVVSTFVPEGTGIYAGSRGGGGQQTSSGNGSESNGGGSAQLVTLNNAQVYEVDADLKYFIMPEAYGMANGSTDWEAALNRVMYDLTVSLDENSAVAQLDMNVVDDLTIASGGQPNDGKEVKQVFRGIVKEAKQYKLYGPADGMVYDPVYVINSVSTVEKYGYNAVVAQIGFSYLRYAEGGYSDDANVQVLLIENNGRWSVIYLTLG